MYKSVLHELLQLENKDGAQFHLNLLMSSYCIQIFADSFITDNNSQVSILLVLISVLQQIQTFKYHLDLFQHV